MKNAAHTFRVNAKKGSNGLLTDNLYILLNAAQNAEKECTLAKRRIKGYDLISHLFDSCLKLCKGGILPDEKQIIGFFSGRASTLAADYLPLCITCALVEYAARGVRSDDEKGEKILGEAVKSLRRMSETDFALIAEGLSETESILRQDPSGFYPLADEQSKAYYRECVARKARRIKTDEASVASDALEKARENSEHIGKYISAQKKKTKGRLMLVMEFLMPLACSVSAGILFGNAALPFLVFIPFYAVFRNPIESVILRSVRPQRLLRLKINSPIVQKTGVLITVSTLMPTPEKAARLGAHLEKLYLSNKTEGVRVCCLADFKGALSPDMPEDKTAVKALCKVIDALNKKHSGGFVLALRPRTFSKTQGEFTGRERKMGAITDLVSAIRGNAKGFELIYGDKAELKKIKYILALDADSMPEFDCAASLTAIALHPQNKPEINKNLGRVTNGYAIIVPKSENRIDFEHSSAFERIMAGSCGGCYHSISGEKYRDLFGESIFCGKGLIDVEAYHELMGKHLPKERILSHDIIESGYLRAALAGDVTVSDGFPKSADAYFARLGRWIRGDWQNLPFIFGKNPLNALSRYKLFDNLFRSLIKPACISAVAASLFLGGKAGFFVALIAAFAVCCDDIYSGIRALIGGGLSAFTRVYYSDAVPDSLACFARAFVSLSFSVRESVVSITAAVKSLWRMLVSKRNLLEWVPAAGGFQGKTTSKILACLPSIGAAAALFAFGTPFYRLLAVILLCDLPLSLFTAAVKHSTKTELTPRNREKLLAYAGATWRFFDELCGKENTFLPPDNLQLSPVNVLARRTSPTNIGLMLLAFLAARDLGFITSQEMYLRLEMSLETVEKLEKYKGNLLNWYSTADCVPLEPRFVSTVDSGNFLCCLTALRQGISEYAAECPSLCNTGAKIDELIEKTDLDVLYNRKRKLFHIGVYPETGEKSESYYDLFMSEARMTSYFAVAKRIVPKEHWSATGRIYAASGRHAGLLSWSGTMFEYFMPSLFLPSPKGSIAHESLRFCLHCQQKKAGRLPFGFSESGFYAFDGGMNYQYKAHGVGKLGLQRGLDTETVVSPYSSFLSAAVAPNLSVRNLEKLEKSGMLGKFGFYEAVDFTKSRAGNGNEIVRSFMAHHQGMSLAAAVNALQNNRMQQRFMRDRAMKGARSLLEERNSTDARIFRDETGMEIHGIREKTQSEERVIRALSPVSPEAAVYSNGRLSVCITDCGTGHSLLDGKDVTVRSEDIISRPRGVFAVFSGNGIRFPVSRALGDEANYTVTFGKKSAIHTAEHKNIRISMKTSVIHGLNCEVRTFEVENNSKKDLTGKLTVYFEPCLEHAEEFSAHPAYSKLFLIDEWDSDNECFVFSRNTKSGDVPAIAAGFVENSGIHRASDREKVLITPDDVFSLGKRENLSEERGNPDCCACFEIDVELKSSEKIKKTLLIAAEDSLKAAKSSFLTVKNGSGKVRYSESLFSNDSLNSTVCATVLPKLLCRKRIINYENDKKFTVSDLWSFGISGDLPIVLAEIENAQDVEKLVPYIRVNKGLRACSILFDLVIIHSADEGYNASVSRAVRRVMSEEDCALMAGVKGGVHVVNLRMFSQENQAALRGFAVLSIDLKNFTPEEKKKAFRPLKTVTEDEFQKSEKSPTSVKQYSFTDNKICIKNRGETVDIPWNMVYANKSFGTMVSDKALGFTWALNSRENKLTPWYNDTASDNRGEILLWKYNGVFYDIIALSQAKFTPEKATWKTEIKGVEFLVSAAVPERGMCKKINIEICNKSGAVRDGELILYVLPVLGVSPDSKSVFFASKTENGALISNSAAAISGYMAVECIHKADFVCFSRVDFSQGRFRSGKLGKDDGCIAVGRELSLAAGGKTETGFSISFGKSKKSALMMPQVSDFSRKPLNPLRLCSDNENLNLFFNSFLYSQVKQSRFYGKTGFWQCSGAYGFRDQLQDSLAFLFSEPEITRTHLLRCAAVQFLEGDVLHWWHVTVKNRQIISGIRTKCSDDLLWLPFVCCEYVRNTADYSVLNVQIPYIESDNLLRNEKERYITPKRSEINGSLLEHCIKAVEKACNFGENGLPLIGSCDWNDAFNNIGTDSAGESVWLAMFLIVVLEKMAWLCSKADFKEKSAEFLDIAESLRNTVEEKAWEGDRYARAILPNGEMLGKEKRFIDILPQAFSVFAGLKNAETAVETAYNLLVDRENRVIRLFSPPFKLKDRESTGYIAAYPEGIRENGGQYTHAVVWLAIAMFNSGKTEKGRELVDLINPLGYYSSEKLSKSYRAEPYVLSGDVSYAEGIKSRAGWSHFTGSAAWFYRCISENYPVKHNDISESNKMSSSTRCKVFEVYKSNTKEKK